MRIVFLGTPEFAVPSLRTLIESPYEVAAVFTQPDRHAGRGQHVRSSPVKKLALEAGIPVFQPERIGEEESRQVVGDLKADFLVTAAYGQILPSWLLRAVRIAPVNIHASLLPRHRGAAPVAWAILLGDTATGVTTMWMDEHMDTGDMLLSAKCPISETITAGELLEELAGLGAGLILPTLEGLWNGTLSRKPQDSGLATLAPRIRKEMGEIDWGRHARDIHNMVRAFNPWPLAFTGCRGARLQILRTSPAAGAECGGAAPGMLTGVTADALRIQCGGGTALDLLEVQLAGRKAVSGRAFGNGLRLKMGEIPFGPAL